MLGDGSVLSAGDDHTVRLSSCDACVPMRSLVQRLRSRLANVATINSVPKARAPNLAALVQGSCIAADDPGAIVRAVSSDCAKPHTLELFASYTLPGALSEPFPGGDELQAQGNALCSGGTFTNYVGLPTARGTTSAHGCSHAQAWEGGFRKVLCFLSDRHGKSTGRSRGAHR